VENFTIEVAERSELGKGGCNRCRRAGFIPAVAYHRADEPLAVQIPYKEFTMLAKKARLSQVFTFKSSSSKLNGKSAIVKDIQQDYIKNKVLHVDFQTLRDDEEITVDVPVKLIGESPGVKVQNGILTLVTHEVSVSCLPKNIPGQVEVDITSLGLGQSIHAGEVKLPAGVVLVDDEHETIVSVVAPRTAAEQESQAAGAEGAAAPAEAAKTAAK
jgi:large subunit ribosomal protein L25